MTDEQRIQEQFEAHFHSLGHSELLTRHPDGFYSTASVRNEWRGFQDGYRARDAEVQALRDVNNQLHRMVSFFASSIKSGEQWSAYHEEEMAALRAAHEEAVDAD